MYQVVFIEIDDNCSTCVTLFRSAIERDCWDYIRSRLTNDREKVRQSAMHLHVRDNTETFCEKPDDIKALVKYYKQVKGSNEIHA